MPTQYKVASDNEFNKIMDRMEQFYGAKKALPPDKWSLVAALQKSLKAKMIMKLNSIDDDRLKIRKCNNGQGAELPTNSKKRDVTIDQFQGLLNKIFCLNSSKDPFFKKKHMDYQKSNESLQNLK